MSGGSRWYSRMLKRAANELRDRIEEEKMATDQVAVAGGNRYSTGIR